MAVAAPIVHPAPVAEDDAFSLGGLSARQLIALAAMTAFLVGSVVLLGPALADLPDLWSRITHGDTRWLALAFGFEILSFLGHIVLFNAVAVEEGSRINLWVSAQINLAGHAATRLLASAGAGGVALTAWAMRRSGMERAQVASRMVTFLVLLYGVYMAALLVGGVGLATGLFGGGGSFAITLVPAAFGAAVIAVALAAQYVGTAPAGAGRIRRGLAPVGAGVREALHLLRSGNLALVGALMWWAFDVAVLWAAFKAFGEAPPIAVITVAYFVGMLANTLPLPGGIGGVDGGMVGALVAFGVDPALALVAVLTYRGFAFWLPILPGALAYFGLRRTVTRWAREDAGEEPARRRSVGSLPWKASAASSTILTSRSVSRRWRSRCPVPSRSPGRTMPSSSPST
jgi:uncharacterized membrane protein YbhN (UPF0104 family)